MMLGTLDKIIKAGFDGEQLRNEIESATLGKTHNPEFIVSECERAGTWCGVQSGSQLAATAQKVMA
jgi:hypothetical protein